jgi:hypothetical protein
VATRDLSTTVASRGGGREQVQEEASDLEVNRVGCDWERKGASPTVPLGEGSTPQVGTGAPLSLPPAPTPHPTQKSVFFQLPVAVTWLSLSWAKSSL